MKKNLISAFGECWNSNVRISALHCISSSITVVKSSLTICYCKLSQRVSWIPSFCSSLRLQPEQDHIRTGQRKRWWPSHPQSSGSTSCARTWNRTKTGWTLWNNLAINSYFKIFISFSQFFCNKLGNYAYEDHCLCNTQCYLTTDMNTGNGRWAIRKLPNWKINHFCNNKWLKTTSGHKTLFVLLQIILTLIIGSL